MDFQELKRYYFRITDKTKKTNLFVEKFATFESARQSTSGGKYNFTEGSISSPEIIIPENFMIEAKEKFDYDISNDEIILLLKNAMAEYPEEILASLLPILQMTKLSLAETELTKIDHLRKKYSQRVDKYNENVREVKYFQEKYGSDIDIFITFQLESEDINHLKDSLRDIIRDNLKIIFKKMKRKNIDYQLTDIEQILLYGVLCTSHFALDFQLFRKYKNGKLKLVKDVENHFTSSYLFSKFSLADMEIQEFFDDYTISLLRVPRCFMDDCLGSDQCYKLVFSLLRSKDLSVEFPVNLKPIR